MLHGAAKFSGSNGRISIQRSHHLGSAHPESTRDAAAERGPNSQGGMPQCQSQRERQRGALDEADPWPAPPTRRGAPVGRTRRSGLTGPDRPNRPPSRSSRPRPPPRSTGEGRHGHAEAVAEAEAGRAVQGAQQGVASLGKQISGRTRSGKAARMALGAGRYRVSMAPLRHKISQTRSAARGKSRPTSRITRRFPCRGGRRAHCAGLRKRGRRVCAAVGGAGAQARPRRCAGPV